MKKLLLTIFCVFITMQAFAQEQAEETQGDAAKEQPAPKEQTSDVKTGEKGKPDFNKKKLSLDRIDEKKWSLRIGYNYFMPDSKYLSMLQNKLKIGGAYDFNKNFQLQLFLTYADGNKSFDLGDRNNDGNEASTKFKATIYDIGLLAVGSYPIALSLGSIAPFGAVGAAYTFGNLNVSVDGGMEEKQNLSGGAVLAQAGLQYSYHIISVKAYAEYLYDFTPVSVSHISSLSGFSIGAELGVKF